MKGSGLIVIFTTPARTLRALRAAQRLAWLRGEPVRLVVMLLVPYPLPLERPPVALEFIEREISLLASLANVKTSVELYLCRERQDVIRDYFQPGSLVVFGGERPGWLCTGERRLARCLTKYGHSVVLAAPDEETGRRWLRDGTIQFRMPNSSR
jgi:hypothetical protein